MGFRRDLESAGSQRNRARFLKRFSVGIDDVVVPEQVHGIRVAIVRRKKRFPRTDGLVTDKRDILLGIIMSDCAPVFLYDPKHQAIGIAHAGWRGTVGGILPRTIEVMRKTYGTKPRNLEITIGPSLRACHHEIRSDVFPRFRSYWRFVKKRDGKYFVDLPAIIISQAIQSGVPRKNVQDVGACTYHLTQRYFSYRRERSPKRPGGTGNMLSVIGLK